MDKKSVLAAFFLLTALAAVITSERELDGKEGEQLGRQKRRINVNVYAGGAGGNGKETGVAKGKGTGGGGATYVRWGRSVCPKGAEKIYNGMASGSKYNLGGGTDQTLCLPNDPEYFPGDTLKSHMGTLWGIRYEVFSSTGSVPLTKHSGLEVPCAVCYVNRSTILTIPAKYNCPTGWTIEYNGYLMSEFTTRNRPRKDTICADRTGESAKTYKPYPSVNYLMNVHCDAGLTCPPYASNKPLTCAVCSK